jgi:hypothetical protein
VITDITEKSTGLKPNAAMRSMKTLMTAKAALREL